MTRGGEDETKRNGTKRNETKQDGMAGLGGEGDGDGFPITHPLFLGQEVELVPQREARLVGDTHLGEDVDNGVLLLLSRRRARVHDMHDHVSFNHLTRRV